MGEREKEVGMQWPVVQGGTAQGRRGETNQCGGMECKEERSEGGERERVGGENSGKVE